MNILLVGNYVNSEQESMQRFAELLRRRLEKAGHEVRLSKPSVLLGRLWRSESGLGKWIGYIDRFILYPARLRKQARWADVVHICDQANAVYLPQVHAKPHVLTCHDMLAIRAALGEFAACRTRLTGRLYQRWILRNISKARAVVCISSETRDDVKRLAGLEDNQLKVIPVGLNFEYKRLTFEGALPHLRNLGLEASRRFFLHVGGNQWYKNRPGVLRLFAALVKESPFESHSLVMAGKPWPDEMWRLARALKLRDSVIEVVGPSSEQLCALYSTADALLFPSLHEGFGWPIAEAQACGCPVVTSNRAPMTEVGGPAAIYIDPENPEGAARVIGAALVKAESYSAAGIANARRFSPKVMTDRYIHSYRELVRMSNTAMRSRAVLGEYEDCPE